jgi:malate synthase
MELTRPPTTVESVILTDEALAFVETLQRRFGPVREKLLAARAVRQTLIDRMEPASLPKFLDKTQSPAAFHTEWRGAPIPSDLLDRRVEITGPVDRKMVINALNSGANVYMADLEDSHSPTWQGTLEGQINLRDAVRREIEFVGPAPEKKLYKLAEKTAVLMVRPRGWHLVEKHVKIDGAPISASLFDFGLFFFHNAKELLKRGSGPYFYLPKMESHLEARLWNDVFIEASRLLEIPRGTIRATVLIETILAAFEMEEILFELKEHSAGLNCGRWDYIFSFIKKFRSYPDFVFPDRAEVTMNTHFLKSYCQLLIETCHRRGVHAMGGMAAQIPIKSDASANAAAMEKVSADKRREVSLGHDGTWVAHPGLVPIAKEAFDAVMKGPNQISRSGGEAPRITPEDLLTIPTGKITEKGLRTNVNVALLYIESWLRGTGCVPLYNLMEDAATAEISRAQIWQWIRHPKGVLEDGRKITLELFRSVLREEFDAIKIQVGAENFSKGRFEDARRILAQVIGDVELINPIKFTEFLTLPAYEALEN